MGIKILQTIRQGLIGGGESHVLDLVKYLNKDKFETSVLSFTNGPMVDCLNSLGIKTYVISTQKPFDIRIWWKIKSLIHENNYDLIHAHGSRALSNTYWAANNLSIPLVYTIHGWSFHDDQPTLVNRIRVLTETFLTKKSKINISVSRSNQLTGINNINGFKSIIINNGVDLTRFYPNNGYPSYRKSLDINDETILIGFVGRMTHQKNPLILLKAFSILFKNYDLDIKLLMVGEGELLEKAVQLTKELNIDAGVIFKSFTNDVPLILQAIDIFCLPSLWEGMPLALMEAMAVGKPVIATQVDGSRELIRDGINGLLCIPGDLDSLVESLLSLVSNKVFRSKLGFEAHKNMVENYSIDKTINNIENIYHNLI